MTGRRSRASVFQLAILLLAATLPARAQSPRVAVYDFEDINPSKPQQIGRKLSDRLLAKLANAGVYQMVDRQFIDRVMKEQQMPAGRFDPSTAVAIGKLLNVAAIVDGTITTFTVNRRSSEDSQGVYGSVTVAATARLISTETGAILRAPVASEDAKGILQAKRPQAQMNCRIYPVVGRVCSGPQQGPQPVAETKTVEQLLDEAMEACALSLSNELAAASSAVAASSRASGNQPPSSNKSTAAVIGVSEGITYINWGSNRGLRVGQTLQVSRSVAVPGLTDPETGQPLTRKKRICTLTLSEVDNRTSSGTCKGDTPAPKDGVDLQSGSGGDADTEPAPRLPLASINPGSVEPASTKRVNANQGNDVAPPCNGLADHALDQMRNPPPAWASVSQALYEIQTRGLNAYIQANGGAFGLLRTTRRDLARLPAGDNYGVNLNQAWIDLLVCLPHEPVRYQPPPDTPERLPPPDPQDPSRLVAECEASAELSNRCAEAYIAHGLRVHNLASAEYFYAKALHIREQGPHTDQSLALALELEAKGLRDSNRPGAQDLLDRAFVLRRKSVSEMNGSPPPSNEPVIAPDDPGVSPPRLRSKSEAWITDIATLAHIGKCIVSLSFIVDTDGRPRSVNLLKGCGLGLDESATTALIQQWIFVPATKAGRPVRIAAHEETTFFAP